MVVDDLGVMLFLSFAEIFVEAKEHFSLVITNEHYAYETVLLHHL